MLGGLQEGQPDPLAPHARKLIQLWQRQAFPFTTDGWTSRAIGPTLWEAAQRVRDVARELSQTINTQTADVRAGYLVTREADAQKVCENFILILRSLPTTVQQLQEQLTDENRMVGAAQQELQQLQR